MNIYEEINTLALRAETAEAALERSAGAALELRAELADVYRRAEEAEAALAALQTPCVWVSVAGGWLEPGCDAPITTTRRFPFCMHCGHPVKVAE